MDKKCSTNEVAYMVKRSDEYVFKHCTEHYKEKDPQLIEQRKCDENHEKENECNEDNDEDRENSHEYDHHSGREEVGDYDSDFGRRKRRSLTSKYKESQSK